MTQHWLKLANTHHDVIAMASIGAICVTGLILPLYRDALKKHGRKVYPVKYWPIRFGDRLDTVGYTIAFWSFKNDSLPYNLLLTAWRAGFYGAIASIVLAAVGSR